MIASPNEEKMCVGARNVACHGVDSSGAIQPICLWVVVNANMSFRERRKFCVLAGASLPSWATVRPDREPSLVANPVRYSCL